MGRASVLEMVSWREAVRLQKIQILIGSRGKKKPEKWARAPLFKS